MNAIDPVCGMSVDTDKAWGKLEHEGTVYYFCSGACAKAFAEHPERYVAAKAGTAETTAKSHGHGGCCSGHGHHGGGHHH